MASSDRVLAASCFLLEHSSAVIKVLTDGSANLIVSPCEMGQGILGAVAQVATECTGLRYDQIRITTGDTDVTLFDIGSHASRSMLVIGNAVADAGRKIKEQIRVLAVPEFEKRQQRVSVDDIDVREGRVFLHRNPAIAFDVREVTYGAIYNYGTEGGQIVAIGRAINPQLVEAQLEGGAVQGLGFALTEDFTIDHESGRVLTDSLLTYRVPRATEIPEIETILIEDPAAAGPPIRNVRYSAAIEGKADLARTCQNRRE